MALRLSPSGYQKIVASGKAPRTVRPTAGTAARPTAAPRSSGPDTTGQALGMARAGLNLGKTTTNLVGAGKDVSTGLSGLQAAAQAAQGIHQLTQGQNFRGTLNLAGAGLSATPTIANLAGASPQLMGTLGPAAGIGGGILGLAGSAYGMANNPEGPGIGDIGNLFYTGSTLASQGASLGANLAAQGSTGALASAAPALGAIAGPLAGAGATIAAGQSIHGLASALDSGDDRQLGAGIGGMTGLAAGALIGTLIYPGIGTLIGMGVGAAAGGALGGMFGQNVPHYYAVREHAQDVGTGAAQKYVGGLREAGLSGDINQVQQALGQGFADDRVRVDFDLPENVAAAAGLPTKIYGRELQKMPPEQFMKLLKVWSEHKGTNTPWVQGSGDIPYLSGETTSTGAQGPAARLASQAQRAGVATMNALADHFAPQLDAMPAILPLTWENVGDYRLAPELEYSQYIHHGVETPYHQRNIPYEQVKQAALQNALAGQTNTGYSIRGIPLAEGYGEGAGYIPTSHFAASPGARAKRIQEIDDRRKAMVAQAEAQAQADAAEQAYWQQQYQSNPQL